MPAIVAASVQRVKESKMLRGEFRTPSGLVIPNNITKFGAETILAAALRNTVPAFWVGLVDGVPDPDLQAEDLTEPTIATNGYARIQIARSNVGWPTAGETNNEPYLESDWLTWAATGGNFNQAIRRMAIFPDDTDTTGNVFALSAALPALRTITPTTLEADRRFKYRIYLR
jgi:hypothetical protein